MMVDSSLDAGAIVVAVQLEYWLRRVASPMRFYGDVGGVTSSRNAFAEHYTRIDLHSPPPR
jgi:hypothetical protein